MAEAPAGLEGLIVSETTIGNVRGEEGFYHYRQYSAVELAEKRSFEDVWYLLFNGELPDSEQSQEFSQQVAVLRAIPDGVREVLSDIVAAVPTFVPLDALRTAMSLTGAALGFKPSIDVPAEVLKQNALQACSVVPSLIAALWRLHNGQKIIAPDPTLSYAANYLYMISGERPDPVRTRAIEQYLISTIDHGFNSSTFTGRVITSTGADLGAALTGAIGALSGPLHGGAPSRALDMLDAIGSPDRAEEWIRSAIVRGDRIMGFGHRVYKTDDPRSVMLHAVAQRLGGDLVTFAEQVEETVVRLLRELKPGRRLYTNVEFYAGVVMNSVGLDRQLFTPTFTASRTVGWSANILEQAANNRLIRPSARYVGPEPPQPVPTLD
jgi:citrate synthase